MTDRPTTEQVCQLLALYLQGSDEASKYLEQIQKSVSIFIFSHLYAVVFVSVCLFVCLFVCILVCMLSPWIQTER